MCVVLVFCVCVVALDSYMHTYDEYILHIYVCTMREMYGTQIHAWAIEDFV